MTPAPPSSPKLDAVFQSMKAAANDGDGSINFIPLLLIGVAVVLMYVAIKHWHRRRAAPQPLRNHRKLLGEAARASSISRRQMKRLNGLASDAGLSSPLVALICPSAINRMATHIRDDSQRAALRSVAEEMVREQREAEKAAA